MGFKTRPNRYRKQLLTDQGAGVRLRGARKEFLVGNLNGNLNGALYSTPGTSVAAAGFISFFIKFYNQSVDQTIFGYTRNLDRAPLGKLSPGLSCYLEGGKVVVNHQPDNSTNSWWRVTCVNAVADIRHIHIQVVGGITGNPLVNSPFIIHINGEAQPTTFLQGSATIGTAEWYNLYFGSQKEFDHDFLLKSVTIGRTRCTEMQRSLLYNNGRGLSFAQTQQQLAGVITLYYDWTLPAFGGFNAGLCTNTTRHINLFPGFTPTDVADGYQQYIRAQNGASQILPHAIRPIDMSFSNYIYPECKAFYRYGGYTGKWVQSNGSTEMPQNLGVLDISYSKHGSVNAPAVSGIPDSGSTEVTTITNSQLRSYLDAGQTPNGFCELVYETASPLMSDFNVNTSRKSKITFTLKNGLSQCVINNSVLSTNFLDQNINTLWDWTKVLSKMVDVSGNPKLVGSIPQQYSLLTSFDGSLTGLTNSPTAGWGTSTVKTDVYLFNAGMVGTHSLINVNDFQLSNSFLASVGSYQFSVFNSASPSTTSNIVDMRSSVAGTSGTINLAGANVSGFFMPPNGRFLTSLGLANNPDLVPITNMPTSYRVLNNTGTLSVYNCGNQPTFLLGTVFPARIIYYGQLPQASFEAGLANLFANPGNLMSAANNKQLTTHMGSAATGANVIPESMITALVNHCLVTNTGFSGWTPNWSPANGTQQKVIHPVRYITQPPSSYSFGGVTGNNQRIVAQTNATAGGVWPVSGTTYYLTDSTGGNPTMNGAWKILGRYTTATATGTPNLTATGTAAYVVLERLDGTFNNQFAANELALISAQQGY